MREKVELKSPEFQKHYDQNMRILGEFPWLWGVSREWAFVYDKLSVGKADDGLTRFLYDEEPDQTIQVWAYIRSICMQHRVARIEWRDYAPQYGIRIYDYCHYPEKLEHIALLRHVKGGDGVVGLDHRKVHIYRPREKKETLSEFVNIRPVALL